MVALLIWIFAVPTGGAVFAKCEHCHTASNWHTIKASAVFDHDPTGFRLRFAHAEQACNQCHKDTPLKSSACVQCHQDTHSGQNGDRCTGCHDSRSWQIPDARVQHRKTRMPLVGGHVSVPCQDCHPKLTDNTWTSVASDCAACHLPLARAIKHPRHDNFLSRCDDCHTPYGWRPAQVAHARFWPLTGAHRVTDCGACHIDSQFSGTERDCAPCHQDDFTRGHRPDEDQDCARCHQTTAWTPADFPGHVQFFPLPHRGVRECADCHPQNTATFSCMTCHPHEKSGMDREHRKVPGYAFEAVECLRCHPRGLE